MTPNDHVLDHTRDQQYKDKMRNGLCPHTFQIGDSVIVKQTKANKLTPAFNPTPLRITEVQGSRITAHEINGSWTVMRDASYFRKIKTDMIADNEARVTENENVDTGALQKEKEKEKEQETPDENIEEAQRP